MSIMLSCMRAVAGTPGSTSTHLERKMLCCPHVVHDGHCALRAPTSPAHKAAAEAGVSEVLQAQAHGCPSSVHAAQFVVGVLGELQRRLHVEEPCHW
jgi:hypothetical protein